MKIIRKDLPKSKVELSIQIEKDKMIVYIDKTTSKLAKQITMPGFRKGEAPKELVVKQIHPTDLLNETFEYAINESYKQAIEKEKLSPLDSPEIKLSEKASKDNLEYTAIISIMPDIKLPDCKKLAEKITKEQENISDKDVEEAKKYLQKSRGTQNIVDRESKAGDIVSLDYVLTIGKKEFDKSYKMPVEIGAGNFIPGFENEIIGLKSGDKKEFDIQFPDEYHNKDLAGKKSHFAISVNDVQEINVPAWDDEFAKELTNGEKTISDLEMSLKEGLIAERKKEVQTQYTQAIVDEILANINVDLPDVLVIAERDQIIQEMEQRALYSGNTLDDALVQSGKTRDSLLEEAIPQAESRVKLMLVLRAIAAEQGFKADEKEVQHRINHILERYSDKEKQNIDMQKLTTIVTAEITDKISLDYIGNL
jgi:trigger factor